MAIRALVPFIAWGRATQQEPRSPGTSVATFRIQGPTSASPRPRLPLTVTVAPEGAVTTAQVARRARANGKREHPCTGHPNPPRARPVASSLLHLGFPSTGERVDGEPDLQQAEQQRRHHEGYYEAGIDESGRFRGTAQPTGVRPGFSRR